MKRFNAILLAFFLVFMATFEVVSAPPQLKPNLELSDTGEIRGIIDYCGTGGAGGVLGYIPGKTFMLKTGPDGMFIFHFVPAATYNLVFEIPGQSRYTVSNVVVSKKSITDLGTIQYCPDSDNDGYNASVDCNDTNPAISPGAFEICGDGFDNNCDATVDEGCQTCSDNDADGFFAQEGCGSIVDCIDYDAAIFPGAVETCSDDIDNDCDGQTDDNCPADQDGDGYSSPADCNDENSSINPGAQELCDNLDNDCDGITDDVVPALCPLQIGVCRNSTSSCIAGQWSVCDYTAIPYYSLIEVCDNRDNDCDGTTDEQCVNPSY